MKLLESLPDRDPHRRRGLKLDRAWRREAGWPPQRPGSDPTRLSDGTDLACVDPALPSHQLQAEHKAHARKTESMIPVDRARQSRLSLSGILSASEPPGVRDGTGERGNDTASGKCHRTPSDPPGIRPFDDFCADRQQGQDHDQRNQPVHRVRVSRDAPVVRRNRGQQFGRQRFSTHLRVCTSNIRSNHNTASRNAAPAAANVCMTLPLSHALFVWALCKSPLKR